MKPWCAAGSLLLAIVLGPSGCACDGAFGADAGVDASVPDESGTVDRGTDGGAVACAEGPTTATVDVRPVDPGFAWTLQELGLGPLQPVGVVATPQGFVLSYWWYAGAACAWEAEWRTPAGALTTAVRVEDFTVDSPPGGACFPLNVIGVRPFMVAGDAVYAASLHSRLLYASRAQSFEPIDGSHGLLAWTENALVYTDGNLYPSGLIIRSAAGTTLVDWPEYWEGNTGVIAGAPGRLALASGPATKGAISVRADVHAVLPDALVLEAGPFDVSLENEPDAVPLGLDLREDVLVVLYMSQAPPLPDTWSLSAASVDLATGAVDRTSLVPSITRYRGFLAPTADGYVVAWSSGKVDSACSFARRLDIRGNPVEPPRSLGPGLVGALAAGHGVAAYLLTRPTATAEVELVLGHLPLGS